MSASFIIGLGIILVVAIFSFRSKNHFWLKMIFLSLGIAGLYLMIFPPIYTFHPDPKTLSIPCKGHNVTKDSSFLNLAEIGRKLNTTEEPYDKLHICLSDIDLREMQILPPVSIQLTEDGTKNHPISEVSWPRPTEFSSITITGTIDTGLVSQILLVDHKGKGLPCEVLDSNFNCTTQAPAKGLYEYELQLARNNDTLREIIPLSVEAKANLNILALVSFPNAELNQLKNYWVSKGGGIAQRIKISTNKFQSSFYNTSRVGLKSLSSEELSDFRLVYCDFSTWNLESASTRFRIIDAIKEQGLGLILYPDKLQVRPKDLPFLSAISVNDGNIAGVDSRQAKFRKHNDWKTIHKNGMETGQSITLGAGNVVVVSNLDSYKLTMHNQNEAYSSLWYQIFNQAHISSPSNFKVMGDQFVMAGKKVELPFISDVRRNITTGSKHSIQVADIPFIKDTYRATLIPKKGWNTLQDETGILHSFYGFSPTDWRGVQEKWIKESINFHNNNITLTNHIYEKKAPWPWWIAFLLFLFGFGGVWFVERVS